MILVDDGSPDKCPQICDEYAQKDERIRVVHKENGGLPSARQAGFEHAKGEYLMFLDSDDSLLPKAIYTLYNKIKEGYDIVRGRNYMVFDDGSKKPEEPKLATGTLNSADEYFKAMINATMSPYLWGAIYKRSLFSSEIFEPIKPFTKGEDWLTNLSIAKHVDRVCLLNDFVYCYYINQQSIMHQYVCAREYSDQVEELMLNILRGCPQEWEDKRLESRMIGLIRNLFCPELGFDKKCYDRIRNYIKYSQHYMSLSEILGTRYMRFIKCEPLYRVYTAIYRHLYLFMKQRGKKRKLIKPRTT